VKGVCDSWFPLALRHGDGTLWWCKHHMGIMEHHLKNRKEIKKFKERHARKVEETTSYKLLSSICDFRFRSGVANPGDGWYCKHGFTIASLTELALDNLTGWHYNYTKDKEELRDE